MNNAESERLVWLISRILINEWVCFNVCNAFNLFNEFSLLIDVLSSLDDSCCSFSFIPDVWPVVCSIKLYLDSLLGWNGIRSFDQLIVNGLSPNASHFIWILSPFRIVSALNEFLKCAGT